MRAPRADALSRAQPACFMLKRRIRPVSQTIHISEKSASLLAQQAAKHGVSLEAWIEELASEKALSAGTTRHGKTRAAAEGILELQKQIKPDPEGWTIRDYIDYGRR